MKKILALFFFIPLLLSAQDKEVDSLRVKASLSLTGFFQGGNVETIIFRAKTDLKIKLWENSEFSNVNSYVYQEFGREKADEDVLSLNFLSFHTDKRLYPFVLGFVSTNFRRQIDLRYLLGAGVTYQLMKKEKNSIKFSISSEFEQTDYVSDTFNISEYDGEPSINTFRGTFWLTGKHELFKDKLVFKYEGFFQPSLEQSNNYRWRADLSTELPIWDFLSFKINYLYTYENLVIQEQKRHDSFLTFGFTLKNF